MDDDVFGGGPLEIPESVNCDGGSVTVAVLDHLHRRELIDSDVGLLDFVFRILIVSLTLGLLWLFFLNYFS